MNMIGTEITDRDQEVFSEAYDLFAAQRFGAAAEVLANAIEQNPRNPWTLSLYGLCLSAQEEVEEGLTQVEAAVEIHPKLSFAHYARSNILSDLELLHEALISIREAIRLQPEEVTYYSQLGIIYFQLQRWPEAVAAANRGLALSAEDEECRLVRRKAIAMYEAERGQHIDDSVNTLHRITVNANVSADRGWVELCNQNYEQAQRYFADALTLEPRHRRARKGMAKIMRRNNPLLATWVNLLGDLHENRRALFLVALLFITGAFAHIQNADTMPFGTLWLLPGLFTLIIFASVDLFLHSALRPWLVPERQKKLG